jgi:hypothetical protein
MSEQSERIRVTGLSPARQRRRSLVPQSRGDRVPSQESVVHQ